MNIITNLFLWLYKVGRRLKKNKIGKKICGLIEVMKIRVAIRHLYYWKIAHYNELHPTEQMKESRKFFKENKERITRVLNLLEDRESKEVLKRMIRFRCYSKYSDLPRYSVKKQYFINDFFEYEEKEVFVDCGAYNGDSVEAFKKQMKKSKTKYKIIAFEPDEENFKELVQKHTDIFGICAGVGEENGELYFQKNSSVDSALVDIDKEGTCDMSREGITKIPVRSIDNVSKCKDATFIKMDIEGAEYSALLGARNTICTNKPKLAVCIYHSDEDMLRLIELVHEMVPGYRLFVRHHSNMICETVLYAVC